MIAITLSNFCGSTFRRRKKRKIYLMGLDPFWRGLLCCHKEAFLTRMSCRRSLSAAESTRNGARRWTSSRHFLPLRLLSKRFCLWKNKERSLSRIYGRRNSSNFKKQSSQRSIALLMGRLRKDSMRPFLRQLELTARECWRNGRKKK